LITKHPVLENLLLDCGGSYTRAKDLPTNGVYIARLLTGEAAPERFSWNGSTSTIQDQPLLVATDDFDTLEIKATEGRNSQDLPDCGKANVIAVI